MSYELDIDATKQPLLTGSISGTTNQVAVTSNSNSVAQNITLSLPQNINTTATPTFNQVTLNNAPVNNTDAASKKYVDDAVAGENLWDRTGTTLVPHTTGDGIAVDKTLLNTTYTPTGLEPTGTSYWDAANHTFSDVLEDGVIGQRFKESFIDGQNDTGVIITNGTPVEYAGSIGNSGNFRLTKAIVTATKPAFYFIGIATHDITDGSIGKVTTMGKVRGIQTNGANYGESWSAGDILYVSYLTAGYLTKTAPPAPYPAIPAALVISAHASNGTLEIRPTYPAKLTDLSDVNGTPLTVSGQIPVWNNTNKYFDFTSNVSDFEPTLTKGNLTETTTSSLTITGGTGAVIGSGTTIALPQDIKTTSSPTFANITDTGVTASRAVVTNAGQVLSASSTTATELGYVNGVTSALQPQLDGKEPFHGFTDSSKISLSVSGLTVSVTKLSDYTVYVGGKLVSITETKTINIADTTGLHYVVMDNTGTLSESTSAWDIKSYLAIPVCIIWRIAGVSSRIWKEPHSYKRNVEWHYWAHHTIGARYISGFLGTFTTSTISVTAGEIDDEDLDNTTSGIVTTVTHVYRATGGVNELYDATPSTTFIKTNGTNPVWDNNGTLTAITNNNYGNFFVYATNDNTNTTISTSNTQLYCVVGQGDYATVAAAQAAPLPTLNPMVTTAEWKVLYRVIARRTTGAPAGTYIQADDLRAVSTGPAISGSAGTVTAATVTFSPAGNIAATNVQTAIEELDTEKAALAGAIFTGNITQELSSIMKQITTPSNPNAGYDKLYFKSDDKLYKLTSGGVETEIGAGGTGTGDTGLEDIFLMMGA